MSVVHGLQPLGHVGSSLQELPGSYAADSEAMASVWIELRLCTLTRCGSDSGGFSLGLMLDETRSIVLFVFDCSVVLMLEGRRESSATSVEDRDSIVSSMQETEGTDQSTI